MEVESCVPPGFRFHPTEEELVGYYLTRKVASQKIDIEVIIDVDLYRIEPWDLQDRCKHGHEDQKEWYFFSHKDKKYPTGTRTNRATAAGFWKATGRDKAVLSKNKIIGMRKTLVFYQGRAPNGRKTDWIMHEYRLQTSEIAPPQEEGWVVCRAFRKQNPVPRQSFNTWSPGSFYPAGAGYAAQFSRLQAPAAGICAGPAAPHFLDSYACVDLHEHFFRRDQPPELEEAKQPAGLTQLLELPQLDSPSCLSSNLRNAEYCFEPAGIVNAGGGADDDLDVPRSSTDSGGQFIDWKVLDRLLVSQLNESASCSNTNLPPILLDFEAAGQGKEDAFVPSCSSSL